VAGCRFSEEWVDYLELLPAFVRDCRAPDVHLIDPLAIDEDGLDALTTMGLGPVDDPMDPSRRLHRHLPLSLGHESHGFYLCYYDLESNETPAQLLRANDLEGHLYFGVWDQWIQERVLTRSNQVIPSPVAMLGIFTRNVHPSVSQCWRRMMADICPYVIMTKLILTLVI
jgi:hypothetical protein